jgi:hypothetical protein
MQNQYQLLYNWVHKMMTRMAGTGTWYETQGFGKMLIGM